MSEDEDGNGLKSELFHGAGPSDSASSGGESIDDGNLEANTPHPAASEPINYGSEATDTFGELLDKAGISLAVSTYQAGKLIFVRSEGGQLNTHFRDFSSPMGLAYRDGFLAVGDRFGVWQFRNMRAIGAGADGEANDAIFIPSSRMFSGDIRIHEIGWAGSELWAVNTRFSCLCTFDGHHSFVPRWRPSFVSGYSAEDRCHLSGMCLNEDRPMWVSCHARTDTAEGWRGKKLTGGSILEVESGAVLLDGLCMPHSPRVVNGRLWFLESGEGWLCSVDVGTGEKKIEARLPGFTRGLDFFGRYAFVGLSRVREKAIFGGLPISKDGDARTCGIWIFDMLESKVVGFLRFSGTVQEIFSIQVLPFRMPDLRFDDPKLLEDSFYVPANLLDQFQPAPKESAVEEN